MKVLKYILFFITTTASGQDRFPFVMDTIKANGVISSHQMLEGGFELIGFSTDNKIFDLSKLDDLYNLHLHKYILLRESIKKSEEGYMEIEESEFEIPPSEQPPPPPPITDPTKDFELGQSLQVKVDTSQIVAMPEYIDNSEVRLNVYDGSIREIYESEISFLSKYYKQTSDKYEAYPLQVINLTDSIVEIETKEGWIYMIQEAIDSLGNWKPIEYIDYRAICGNSYSQKSLLPDEYLISMIYKYSGSYATKLRVKFATNKSIYYSNEFDGKINYSQFEVPDFIRYEGHETQNDRFLKN
ncbi:hypothetical protein OKW21_006753 [Catalinimonas alkaloidigena]|uniref:hypothetical protein n=1 Tax=Catalinimonas alkaloidigena TaxID=1075417 RepID=UPI0024054B4C|nr:hypothetical protein [Catalinimonas alkaloidigena]MDF9801444.1 hypothetical protein [Catalinimonas alkaloidigena]